MPAVPPSTPPSAPRATTAPELRRHLLFLVLGVVALDVVALLAQRWLGVDGWSRGRRQAFTAVWVGLTLVVVSVFLGRMRATRLRARRARAAGR